MIQVPSIDSLVPLLFDNYQFISKLKQTYSKSEHQIKPKPNPKQTYNKSVLEAIEEMYQDIYQIIHFNLNQSINTEFNDLVKEVIDVKKEILSLDVTWNKKINQVKEEIEKMGKEIVSERKKKEVGGIQQVVKEKIEGAKSVLKRYKETTSAAEIIEKNLDQKSHLPDKITRRTTISEQKTYNHEFKQQFQEFKRNLKKSNQLRFQNIWRVIISIRQTLDQILPSGNNPEEFEFLSTDASCPEDQQKDKQRSKEQQFLN